METGFLFDTAFERHDAGPGHPESPRRLQGIAAELKERGLDRRMVPVPSRPATDVELSLAHEEAYLEQAEAEIAAGAGVLSTGDTYVGPESFAVARQATGGVLNAVDAVLGGKVDNAFCAVRPPGHHATADRGMGFCILNHVAVAARYAQRKHGVERVAIIDWDVHHGNGTQDIFYRDGSVFYFSTHQSPWYPGTGALEEGGEGPGKGSTFNAPLPAGTDMTTVRNAFTDAFLPLMKQFRPQLLLISAGFDSRLGDPLGKFRLLDEDFAELTALLMDLASRGEGNHRVVSVLEGGYNVEGLSGAVAAHVETLLGAGG